MKKHQSPRSYGTKLMEPSNNQVKVESLITTRKFDVAYYERTGELKYLEEESTMPDQNAIENANRMRAEITTVEQFKAIGSYSMVAKKYMISKSTAHGHMLHLRSLAKKAEKATETATTTEIDQGLGLEEIERFHTDSEKHELPEVELEAEYDLDSVGDEFEGKCDKEGKPDSFELTDENPLLSDKALERLVSDLEAEWKKPKLDQDIDKLKKSITTGITALHKMFIYRAEMDFQEWILEVVEEC